MDNLHHRTCPLCEATCGLELEVTDGAVRRIRGDRDDVFSKGFLCPKGSVLHHLNDDPDRLRSPMIKQDDGSHREVTWDEAFAEVERLMVPLREAHGPDSTAVYVGNPNVHGSSIFSLQALVMALATTNLYTASSVDQLPKEIANGLLYGDPRAWGVPDLDRTDLLVVIGANPVVSGGSLATAPDWPGRIASIRERGGHVLVIDPRRTETAAKADDWWGIRPGTDVLLLAALAHTVFSEELVDLGAAAGYCDGLESLASALGPYSADRVATATGISADRIIDLARRLASTDRAVVYGRVGLQTHEYGTLASWLTDVVNIITGHLDVPGGQMFATPAMALTAPDEYPDGFTIGRWSSRVHGHPECRGELPTATLADEILVPGDGQVRSMICLAGNPVRSCPDSARLEEAFASLECLVSVDIYRNETSKHAHVILPPPGPLERSHADLFFYAMAVRNVVNWSPPLFAPTGPTEEDIHLRLAAITMGMGAGADLEPLRSMMLAGLGAMVAPEIDVADLSGDTLFDQAVDLLLRSGHYDGLSLDVLAENPHGIDLGPLEPTLPDRLRTPDRRITLVPPLIADDLPRLERLLDARPSGDVVLIGRRQLRSNNTWMHNVRILMKGTHRCTLLVPTSDAARLGIVDGDLVEITSRVGRVTAPAEVTDDLVEGVVSLPHGWGHDAEGQSIATGNPGVNSNVLTDPQVIDPLSGACAINAIPVSLARVDG